MTKNIFLKRNEFYILIFLVVKKNINLCSFFVNIKRVGPF